MSELISENANTRRVFAVATIAEQKFHPACMTLPMRLRLYVEVSDAMTDAESESWNRAVAAGDTRAVDSVATAVALRMLDKALQVAKDKHKAGQKDPEYWTWACPLCNYRTPFGLSPMDAGMAKAKHEREEHPVKPGTKEG